MFSPCNCALPAINGNTKCCEHCANNPWKQIDLESQWEEYIKDFKDFKWDNGCPSKVVEEFDDQGHLIKITYYN
jgi:hypothetical protein